MIVVVMGVSGSGKTTVGTMLSERLQFRFAEGDDFHPRGNISKMASGIALNDMDRWPWLDSIACEMKMAKAQGENLVVACSALKKIYRQRLMAKSGCELHLVLLNGDRDDIFHRMSTREDHFMSPKLLDSQLATLEQPDDDEGNVSIIEINNRTPEDIVSLIVKALDTALPKRSEGVTNK
eukprot:m.340301 g.340301  ORF g.340301 m.340301 type:complete len:180 (-) comp20592_c0_seq3:2680-3219(-)